VGAAFGIIQERYEEIAEELGVTEIGAWLAEIREVIENGTSKDWIASRGEYLNARIIARFLDAKFVDAANTIKFKKDGTLSSETYKLLGDALSGGGLFVVPGFYGSDPNGKIKCFSRGGSDVTGAIVARATCAEVYENWTDVPGMLMADPRIVTNPKPIAEVTYREMRELSYMGATVLHDEAIFPVRDAGIPINIRNTNDPSAPGTRIVTKRDSSNSSIIGVAGRIGFTAFFTEKAMMNSEIGFGKRLLEVFERQGISYEHSPTSIDTMSVVVADDAVAGKEDAITHEIEHRLGAKVEISNGLALIATVGEGMSRKLGIAGRLFTALANAGINIRMIDQGGSEINIIIGIASKDYEKAVKAIYAEFVSA
jgi:aspartate kinase